MDEYKLTTVLVKSILSVISNDPTEICGGIFTGINRVIRATCIIVPVYQNQIEIIDWEQVNYSFQSPVPEQIHEAFVEFLQKLLELDVNFNAITANKKVLKLIIDILNMTTKIESEKTLKAALSALVSMATKVDFLENPTFSEKNRTSCY